MLGLGEDKRALNRCLREQGDAAGLPRCMRGVEAFGLRQVFFDRARVRENALIAGLTNVGMRLKRLLDHRADQAGDVRQFVLAFDQRGAEIDVGSTRSRGSAIDRKGALLNR